MKPYATSFTFDPVDGTIRREHPSMGSFVIAEVYNPSRDPRQAATARLLAESPGALVECLEALKKAQMAVGNAAALAPNEGSESYFCRVSDESRAAILRAETVLGVEKGKP